MSEALTGGWGARGDGLQGRSSWRTSRRLRDQQMGEWSGGEALEQPQIGGNLLCVQGGTAELCAEKQLLNKRCWDSWMSIWKKNELDPVRSCDGLLQS